MGYVYDSSFIGAIIIPDEKNPDTDKIRESVRNDNKIFVPQLFWYEITNMFKNLIRRKRFTYDQVLNFYPRLSAIGLICDYETGIYYSQKLLHLCNDYNLSSYDAAYLELAARKNAVLCTLDENLQKAAKKRGLAVLE